MENCMHILLRDFYSAVNRNCSQKQQKVDLLDRFLQKLKAQTRCSSESEKQKAGIQYETQTSFGDLEATSSDPKIGNALASNMLYTFLLPSPENQKESRYKVTSQKAFNHSSIFKTLAYALFINFLHINKQAAQNDCQQNLAQTLTCAARSVRRLKTAMVAAAQGLKSKDRKRYAKIRYLYDQLLKYTDAAGTFKEEYIRVIIDEFDEEFIQRTFECLRKKCNQLNASQSLSNIQLGDSILKDSIDLSEMGRALEYLQVKLIVRGGSNCGQQQLYDSILNVVVEQSEREGFVLREVITMRSSEE